YIITVPHQRLDLRIKEDMIEEVGRMIGYEKLHPKLPELNKKGKINKKLYYQNIIRNILNKRGFEEVITYSFTNKGDVSLIKSASDKNSLRVNVGEGLGEALIKNIYNMPLLNTSDVRLYEFGNVFRLDSDKNVIEKSYLAIGIDDGKKKTDYADLVDQVLIEIKKALNVKNIEYSDRNIKPYTLGIDFGKLINDLPEPEENIYLEGFEDENIKYKSFSLMPFIVRDIAFWCDENTDKQEILKLIEDNVGEFCIAVHIFDEFIKNIDGVNKKSLGYRLIYQAKDRTLTDEEVNEYAGNIYEILKEKGFEIR
ncbi:MAG: phenylalanyl-tRNA synthetase beta chain, partial [Patescibacteria group bacterium]|nr:phenylalanyl-tRNA synthetase beta chain [Patescibacteria group bacterium]